MEHCMHCGSELPGTAQFCGYCGGVIITAAEMPTRLTDDPNGRVLIDDSPRTENRASLSTDELTALMNRMSPGNDAPTVMSSKPSHPGFSNSEQDAETLRGAWPREEATAPLQAPVTEAEEDEEERRRTLLIGFPGRPGLNGTPMILGTPQASGVPTIQATPSSPTLANIPANGSTPAILHGGPVTPLPAIPSAPGSTASSHPRPGGSSCLTSVLILSIIFVVIFGSLGFLFFGLPPSLTIVGGSDLTIGDSTHLHGSHFFPTSDITLTLDGKLPLYPSSSPAVAKEHAGFPTALEMNVIGQLSSAHTSIKADSGGSFDIRLQVGANWGIGMHTLHARESIGSRSAVLSFTVIATTAKMIVAPSTLDFGALNIGQQLTRSISISNVGNLALQWQANTGNAGWMKLDKRSGTLQVGALPETVKVTVDTSALSPGSQTVPLIINSNGGIVQVTVKVLVNRQTQADNCTLQTPSPASETFSASTGSNPSPQAFTIGVTGACGNGVTITPTPSLDNGTGWLSVTPSVATIATGSTSFTVAVDTSSLAAGTYTGSIVLTGESGGADIDGSPQTVSVTLTVTPSPPVLSVDSTSMSFTLSNGDKAASKSFNIANTGGSTMDWTAVLDPSSPSFVTLGSASGTGITSANTGSDSVNVDPSGQTAGSYQATVILNATDEATGNAALKSPAKIVISITITQQPSMQLSSNNLTFTPNTCTPGDDNPVTLTNTGGSTLTWSIANPVYTDSGDPGGWLVLPSPTSGSGDATLNFTVDGTGAKLVAGQTYTASVTITGTDQANGNPAKNSPQTIYISFTEPNCGG